MNIVFFVRRFYPLIGGVEKHVYEISKRLVATGNEVTVITENKTGKLPKKSLQDGITIYRIDVGKENWFRKFIIWKELFHYKKVFASADIIHCHDVFFWYLPFRFLFWQIPIFTTFHGYETVYPPTRKAKLVRKLSEKLSIGTICVGDYIKKWYGTKPDDVTYGGVSTNKLKENKSTNKLQIDFVGRLAKDTGISLYLSTLAGLKKKKIAFSFDAYGDGALKKEVKHYGTVHGFVSDISQKIAAADIVFASSYLSILEALSAKKLVVSVYDNPLKEDYLKMTPFSQWILIGNDPAQVTQLIQATLADKNKLNQKKEEAYAWIKKQSWDNVTNLYKTLWERKIQKH